MDSKSKNSQITIFFILVLVMVIIVVSVVLVGRTSSKKTTAQESSNIRESSLDIQPVKNFIEGCLSLTSKDALIKLGQQGGIIIEEQGGTSPSILFEDTYLGQYYLNLGAIQKVAYNIIEPRSIQDDISHPDYDTEISTYPWEGFPFIGGVEKFAVDEPVFGANILPSINDLESDAFSIPNQLKKFTENNIETCLDLSAFEEQGFDISNDGLKIDVTINDNDVIFKMQSNITAINLITEEIFELKSFIVKQDVRLGLLHNFVQDIINRDIKDISFDITSLASSTSFAVRVERDVFDQDDIIIVTDTQSKSNYQYFFARKNRIPALFNLPTTIQVPSSTTKITFYIVNESLSPIEIKAIDPDEDSLFDNQFSIRNEPIIFDSPSIDIEVVATDLLLEDFQTITIEREP